MNPSVRNAEAQQLVAHVICYVAIIDKIRPVNKHISAKLNSSKLPYLFRRLLCDILVNGGRINFTDLGSGMILATGCLYSTWERAYRIPSAIVFQSWRISRAPGHEWRRVQSVLRVWIVSSHITGVSGLKLVVYSSYK